MATIFFDMDGTLADFYGVENWLEYLNAEDTLPYEVAKPLHNMQALAHRLNNLQHKGYKLEILSWTSKTGSDFFNDEIATAKLKWLASHFASVNFDAITIIPYGIRKDNFRHEADDILFDDEERNRKDWQGFAFDTDDIFKILGVLGK